MLSVLKGTISKMKSAYKKEGKTSSCKQNSGTNLKLHKRDCRLLIICIVKKVDKITAVFKNYLDNIVLKKIFCFTSFNLMRSYHKKITAFKHKC